MSAYDAYWLALPLRNRMKHLGRQPSKMAVLIACMRVWREQPQKT